MNSNLSAKGEDIVLNDKSVKSSVYKVDNNNFKVVITGIPNQLSSDD